MAARIAFVALWLIGASASAQIPIDAVTVVGSDPAVLSFTRTATLDSFGAEPGRIAIRTTGTSGWPAVAIDKSGVPVQSGTLWIFLRIDGRWYATGAERLRPNQLNGDKPAADPKSGGLSTLIGNGWLYDPNRWGPMAGKNPAPGEHIGVMVVAGSTRTDNQTPVKARTNILEVVWPSAAGSVPLTVAWREGDTQKPPPPPPIDPSVAFQIAALKAQLERAVGDIRTWMLEQSAVIQQHADTINHLGARVMALEAEQIPARCIASARLGITSIPISCRLEP